MLFWRHAAPTMSSRPRFLIARASHIWLLATALPSRTLYVGKAIRGTSVHYGPMDNFSPDDALISPGCAPQRSQCKPRHHDRSEALRSQSFRSDRPSTGREEAPVRGRPGPQCASAATGQLGPAQRPLCAYINNGDIGPQFPSHRVLVLACSASGPGSRHIRVIGNARRTAGGRASARCRGTAAAGALC